MSGGAWGAFGVVVAVLVAAAWLYNRLVRSRNQARQGFADIDVQLKRRADLVPQLVEAVRGYAAHERALLENIATLRAAAVSAASAAAGPGAARFAAERGLGATLQRVLVLQEAYPQLKADANFRDLSARLVEVEDHLQYARRFYNGAVKEFRDLCESFPEILVARAFGFSPPPFFETDDRAPAQVKL